MAEYAVTFSRTARKELEHLPRQLVERIFPKSSPSPSSPALPVARNSKARRVSGAFGLAIIVWSIRWMTRDEIIDVVAVRHRSEAYRD